MQYMQARLIAKAKEVRDDGSIVEIVIWQVPTLVLPCRHSYKYRLYYGAFGVCRVRYDSSNSKFKGHSTGNGWFIANPHPEIKFPG
jgi:Family of unknown function (DUF6516)